MSRRAELRRRQNAVKEVPALKAGAPVPSRQTGDSPRQPGILQKRLMARPIKLGHPRSRKHSTIWRTIYDKERGQGPEECLALLSRALELAARTTQIIRRNFPQTCCKGCWRILNRLAAFPRGRLPFLHLRRGGPMSPKSGRSSACRFALFATTKNRPERGRGPFHILVQAHQIWTPANPRLLQRSRSGRG